MQMALIPNVGTSKPIASVGNRQRRQPRSRSERARQTNAMQPLFAYQNWVQRMLSGEGTRSRAQSDEKDTSDE